MNPDKQHTIGKAVSYTGIALHTGHRARLTFQPAEINTGVIFRRMDLPGKPEVQAIGHNVTEFMRATTIEDGPAVIHTVEHILAALMSRGIDNIYVEMDRPEPPIADGSSMPFLKLLKEAGTVEQNATREYFTIDQVQTLEMEHA